MRVYEFSKQSGIANKELLELLKKAGFSFASHMAVLTPEAEAFLEKKFAKPAKSKTAAPVKESQEVKEVKKKIIEAAPVVANPVKEEIVKKVEKGVATPVPAPKLEPKEIPTPLKTSREDKGMHERKVTEAKEVARPMRPSMVPFKRYEEKKVEIEPAPTTLLIVSGTVEDIAQKIKRPVSEIILTLLKKGVVATKNQMLPERVMADLARSLGLEPIFPEKKKVEVVEKRVVVQEGNLQDRMPVIVVMGHVDHGKTTLLDFIRKTRVAAKEKGGITQHLGAYEVNTAHGGIVFLDTPGHEAFSQIRMRGVKVADITVLVVAADDSVKPQTVEAIRHAKAMELPIIVAANKIDKVEPQRVDVVKRDLAQHDLVPEEWGGNTIFVPISAKVGTGVDQLLEIIALQAQIMELKADPTRPAQAVVLESKLEKGLGPVATIICQEGTIKVGDFFVCGATQGKITLITDTLGKRIQQAGPSVPVQVAGFEELAEVGDVVKVVNQEAYKDARGSRGERKVIISKSTPTQEGLTLIVKTEGNASRQALLGAITQLSDKSEEKITIVHSGVGTISESDVLLAANTGAMIVGLHVKTEPNATQLAQKNNVKIKLFDIIYHLLDEIKLDLEGTKEIEMVKQKIGEAVVRKVFDIKGLGVIAGCYVKDGRVTRDSILVIWRGPKKIGEGKIKSLQREKRSMKEVAAGFECAFIMEHFSDWQVDDRVECFIEVPKA